MVTREAYDSISPHDAGNAAPTRPRRPCAISIAGAAAGVVVLLSTSIATARHGELPNRIPEPAPYTTSEARDFPPPYGHVFGVSGAPQVCAGCHRRIFDEWNGSMMSNAWRDPAWRAAFLLIARLVATDGNCDVPSPPDGTERAWINPFANQDCSSTFDLGDQKHTTTGSGSLLDGFCSRCHMPANYIDAVRPANVTVDRDTGLEHGLVDPDFDPTSARGTDQAFATFARARRSPARRAGLGR
jgi:hypothetical protein